MTPSHFEIQKMIYTKKLEYQKWQIIALEHDVINL